MSQYMSVEIHADAIIETMLEDPDFAMDVIRQIAFAANAGLMRDNLGDVAGCLDLADVKFVAQNIKALGEGMADAFNMANLEQVKLT